MRFLRSVPGARRAAQEQGFALVVTMGTLMVTSLLLVAVLTATNGDIFLSRNDLDQKKAFYAAQGGISTYLFHLNRDVNYWTHCTATSNAQVPGSVDESFSTLPLPALSAPAGTTQCDPANPIASMIEASGPAGGTFRMWVTGSSRNVHRSIVATFRRTSFLNYLYYTKYETLDPVTYSVPSNYSSCANFYGVRPSSCSGINFVTGDAINGPLHSEDTLRICGSPTFGRTGADSIEAPAYSTEGQGGCVNAPVFNGTYTATAAHLLPPPSNAQLLQTALPQYRYTGTTSIVLNGTTMDVTNNGVTTPGVAIPSNGVLYVSSSSCGVSYSPYNVSYTGNAGCGDVYVHGNYTVPLTIGSDNDIIINGNITTPTNGSGTPTTNALLGLIANDFVRIYHPVTARSGTGPGQCGTAQNAAGSLSGPSIYASILALNHSFIVDNYDCGARLGNLSVYGSISQLFRGTVGTGGGTGYLKSYNYDDRLRAEEPPFFLNPVEAAWHVERSTECGMNGAGQPGC